TGVEGAVASPKIVNQLRGARRTITCSNDQIRVAIIIEIADNRFVVAILHQVGKQRWHRGVGIEAKIAFSIAEQYAHEISGTAAGRERGNRVQVAIVVDIGQGDAVDIVASRRKRASLSERAVTITEIHGERAVV